MTVVTKRLAKPKPKSRSKMKSSGVRAKAAPSPTPHASSPETVVESKAAREAKGAERNEYGYRNDSDVAVVLEELMAGGVDKHEVASRIAKRFEGQTTKSGKPKPVSTVMNQVETQMVLRGFRVESSWKLLPPENGVIGPRPKRKSYSRASITGTPAVKAAAGATVTAASATATVTPQPSKRKPMRKPKPRVASTRK